jgi:hypothetical protein
MLRILILIGAGACLVSFFTPLFHVSAQLLVPGVSAKDLDKPATGLAFGWDLWYGILIFVLAFLPLAAGVLDLCLHYMPVVRAINKWVYFVIFTPITVIATLFLILGIFGIGLGGATVTDPDKTHSLTVAEVDNLVRLGSRGQNAPRLSVTGVPITMPLPVLGGALGLVASVLILRRRT